MPVEEEEHVGSDKPDAFIPIYERVVLDKAEPVGGRMVGKVGIGFVSPSMLGSSDGGLQQALISETRLPAVGTDLIGMRCLNGGTWNPGRCSRDCCHLASSRRALRYLLAVRS